MTRSITIPMGLNGPHESANGGVAAGTIAALLPGPAAVRLHRPPPMDVAMAVTDGDDGSIVASVDGDAVLSARASDPPGVEVPRVDPGAVSDGAPYPDHPAATCIVCGPERPDGLGVLPAPVASEDAQVIGLRWTPPAWAIADGVVRHDLLWGVLDCPGALAVMLVEPEPIFAALGSVTGEVHRSVGADESVFVLGWTLGSEGRKRHCATAVVTPDGEVLASTRQVCIAVPPVWASAEG